MLPLRHLLAILIVLSPLTSQGQPAPKDALAWPRKIETSEGVLEVYQPQIDRLEGRTLVARAAISVKLSGEAEAELGAVWLRAPISTDIDRRIVTIEAITVSKVKLADASPVAQKKIADLIVAELAKVETDLPWDQFVATLEIAKRDKQIGDKLESKVPKILFTQQPTVLVYVAGKPRVEAIEGSGISAVVNSPYLVVEEPSFRTFALYGGHGVWYYADQVEGPWKTAPTIGGRFRSLEPDHDEKGYSQAKPPKDAPKVIVATEPTELVETEGPPRYVPVVGDELMMVTNTRSIVLFEPKTKRSFILLSGRWFASKSAKGPWTRVRASKLPASFQKIPSDSKYRYLRGWVAGTEEAEHLVRDAMLPRTAIVPRSKTLEIRYDGAPIFEAIRGTSLEYAVNAETQVLKHGKRYHAVVRAVWYSADSAKGPWRVASEAPPTDVRKIPPSHPAHTVRFVHVYDKTPTDVHVGYTAGYEGSFVEDGVIVYGTGYVYTPYWVRNTRARFQTFYPTQATYGFQARHDLVRGWVHVVSNHENLSFAVGRAAWHDPAWWGPAGFRPARATTELKRGLYDEKAPRRAGKASEARRAFYGAFGENNNLYVDQAGNVYRKSTKGWEARRDGKWTGASSYAQGKNRKAPGGPGTVSSDGPPVRAQKSRSSFVSGAGIWRNPYAFPR